MMKPKKLEETIKEIARVYFISLHHINEINTMSLSNGNIDSYSPFYKYFQDVEKTFRLLDVETQRIINNEYFYNAYAYWWINDYSTNEFKKKKRLAVKSFLEVFYEIH